MSKNLIPQIAEMLGVQLGEKFKIKGDDELTYRFDSDGLKLTHYSGIEIAQISANVALVDLLNGKDEIVKLSWKPKKGEEYYTFGTHAGKWIVLQQRWTNHPFDFALLAMGWIFHSNKEAKATLPKVATEFDAKYEL